MSHHPKSASTGPALPALLDAAYADVDEQAAALNGWNQSYMQLCAGGFQGDIRQLDLDGVRVFREGLKTSVYQTGSLASGTLALGVPLASSGPGLFCGKPCGLDTLHVFSGSSGFEFRTASEHVMLGVELAPELAHSVHPRGEDGPAFPGGAGIHRADPVALVELRQFLVLLFEALHFTPSLLALPTLRAGMVDALLEKVTALHAQAADAGEQPLGHWHMVREAQRLVGDDLAQPPTIAELCGHLGVSRRTLQSGFHRVLGISPLSYLRVARLGAARKSLKSAASVTDAATQHGFWHFGHFAKDYQDMFGELPSQTLRRHRGH
ncbi:helix-turn-helix domain-containing protein [Hydrogenophaga sp.]|uniref:helix-turn-helix domain-containing protein n=1 Tax=Hydrogenophaga sp. TaxID=1904254 RepID=UPI003563483D